MLRVAGTLPPSDPPWVRVGEDVLFDARWERPRSSIMFWQIESDGQNLMIAIDEKSCGILSIDPVITRRTSIQRGTRLPELEERLGTPLIDKRDINVEGSDSAVVTDAEVKSFRILLDDDACTIAWAEPEWFMRSGRVLFGVSSEGFLASVGVDGMNADEHRRVSSFLACSSR